MSHKGKENYRPHSHHRKKKDNKILFEMCLLLCILIHSSPSTSLLQGCAKAEPHGRNDWHLLILMDTKKHVITMTFTPSSEMRDKVWEQQRDKNSEQNSKNKKCEFLMCFGSQV